MTVENYELLLRVRADLQQALQGLNGLDAKLGQVDRQAKAVGESADQATARIQAMVAATARQSKVQESIRSTHERAAAAIRDTINAYDQQTVAVDRTAEAVAAYRAQIGKRAESAAAAAGIRAQTAEMAKLAAQIDPTIAALDKLDKQEAALRKLYSTGAVGAEDFAKFSAVIDRNRLALTNASKAMHEFSLNSAGARREVGRLASDIANGNWGRFDQTAMTLANYTGLMSAAFSPLGLAILAVTGAIAGFAIAANDAASVQNTFNKSILQTGDYAGVTAGQLVQMAERITPANASVSDSQKILAELDATGRLSAKSLESVGQAAADMAQLTGLSTDKATAAVLKMFDGTTSSLLKANDQYHFLTTAIYDQIKALQDEGDTQGAIDAAAQAFHAAAIQRIQEESDQVRGLARVWDSVKTTIQNTWSAAKTGASLIAGTADDQTKLYSLLGRKASAQVDAHGHYGLSTTLMNIIGQGWTPADEAKLKQLQEKIARETKAAELQGFDSQLTTGAVNADAAIDKLGQSLDKTSAKQAALNRLNAEFLALWKGADPNAPDPRLKGVQAVTSDSGKTTFFGGLYDKLRAGIEKRYATKTPRAASDAGAVSAGQQLIKMLNDEQGAVDPVARAWADYNDKVAQANQLAEKAKTARGADVAAINAQRQAVIAEAAAVRDAAIAENAKKDRTAFEKLQQTLQDTNGIKFDQITAQLDSLQKWLDKGVISASEYHAAVQGVLNTGMPALPKYKGLGSAVGGAFGELDKIKAQTDQLDAAYAAQLQHMNDWHEKGKLSTQDYITKENALYKEYYAQKERLQKDSNTAILTGMSASLEESARLLMNSVGKNTEAYRIAFAASKGAAIAQATVNMFKAMSNAGADVPWPGNLVAIANVGASMAVLISQIASLGSGFSQGGYTGPGGVNQPAGIVHAGEVVFSQHDVARHGGVAAVESLRLHGYAEGGIVWPAPQPEPETPISAAMANAAARHRDGGTAAPNLALRIVNHVDPQVTYDAMSSPDGETVILNTIARNATRVRQSIGGH